MVIPSVFAAGINGPNLEPLCTVRQALISETLVSEVLIPVQLKKVIDGDTVILADGRHLRIIGVNTPEMNAGKNANSHGPQPYAHRAKQYLKDIVKGSSQVYMSPGEERKDRYNRTLAHLYVQPIEAQSTHLYSVAAQIIRRGLGFYIVFPPNLKQVGCFKRVESLARAQRLGVWKDFSAIPADNQNGLARALTSSLTSGFALVTGKVAKVTKTKNAWWVELVGELVLKVSKHNTQYFDEGELHNLIGKHVTVRGWVVDRGRHFDNHPKGYKRWMMNIKHPLSID